jgi:ketopantoate reductase PanE/ApbA-like protein
MGPVGDYFVPLSYLDVLVQIHCLSLSFRRTLILLVLRIDARNGATLRLGRKHGIQTPVNQTIVALLEAASIARNIARRQTGGPGDLLVAHQ